jgi:hypothetical protein
MGVLGWNATSEDAITEQLMQAQEHERIRKLNWDKLRTNLASAAVGKSGLGGGNNRSGKIAMAALNTFAKAAEKGNQRRFDAALLNAAAARSGQVDDMPLVDRLVSGVTATGSLMPISPPPRKLRPLQASPSTPTLPVDPHLHLMTGTERRIARESHDFAKSKSVQRNEPPRPPTRELMIKLHDSLVSDGGAFRPVAVAFEGSIHQAGLLTVETAASMPNAESSKARRHRKRAAKSSKNDPEPYREIYLQEPKRPLDSNISSSRSTLSSKFNLVRASTSGGGDLNFDYSSLTALGRPMAPPIAIESIGRTKPKALAPRHKSSGSSTFPRASTSTSLKAFSVSDEKHVKNVGAKLPASREERMHAMSLAQYEHQLESDIRWMKQLLPVDPPTPGPKRGAKLTSSRSSNLETRRLR